MYTSTNTHTHTCSHTLVSLQCPLSIIYSKPGLFVCLFVFKLYGIFFHYHLIPLDPTAPATTTLLSMSMSPFSFLWACIFLNLHRIAIFACLIKKATRHPFRHQKQLTEHLCCSFDPLPLLCPLRASAPSYLTYYLKDFAIFPPRGGEITHSSRCYFVYSS